MTFNHVMASMLVLSLVLVMIGLSRNFSPAGKDKTLWGWFVVAVPFYVIPISVAIYRAIT